MTDGLSYPSLRCVLEYLEANKRIHIIARSPALQRFEKTIPLHLDQLHLCNISTQINYIDHKIYTNSTGYFITANKTKKWAIPEGIGAHEAIKIAKFHVLNGRNDIHVNHLRLTSISGSKLSVNVQLKIRKLKIVRGCFCDELLSAISSSSYPLKELNTYTIRVESLKHEVLKSAATLVISSLLLDDESWFIPSLANLTNSEIVIGWAMSFPDVSMCLRMLKSYLQAPRCIGSRLEFRLIKNDVVFKLLNTLKHELNGKDVRFKEQVVGLRTLTACFIPINSTSVALIYGVVGSLNREFCDVKMQIIPIDAITLVDSRYVLEIAKLL